VAQLVATAAACEVTAARLRKATSKKRALTGGRRRSQGGAWPVRRVGDACKEACETEVMPRRRDSEVVAASGGDRGGGAGVI
jgi:hypothetical protein